MDVFEAIHKRRSVRKFLDVPLDWEPVGQILEAGRLAPTAGNTQDVKFVVVLDPDTREKVAEACYQQYWMSKAPIHIVVCVDPTKTESFYGKRGKEVYATQDAAAAAMSMLLAAEAQGLGACWVAAFEEHQLKRAVGIPENVQAHVVIPIGYADETPKEPLKFGIESLVYLNGWGSRWIHMFELTGEYSRSVEAALKKGKALLEKAKKHLQRV
ncbi:MAG: nitroreductase family protein [Nanoarchaeota archaeon]|mgnify:CR=1 FL=1